MAAKTNIFTTIRTEGALLPADLLQRISEGANVDGLTPDSYHRPGEKLNEAINRSWNALQGAWSSFRTAQEKLPEGDLGTTITRERWLLPLFRELDYGRLQTTPAIEVDGNSYAISHGWEHVPVHLVSYKLDLDKRTPGVAGASTASPHSLVQVALNRSDNHLWGFLSNGYRLRILRDNVTLTRQAYVEFDLEAMMDGEVYSDFVLLWLLCHQSRVEGERPSDCWLEKWMKVAEQQGTRALDQLRGGVEDAITAFGSGFLAHPANAALREKLQSGELDKQDYYRQLLRLVYRMLFLFVAEDRQIDGRSVLLDPNAPQDAADRYMKYYSTQRLRGMAESFKGTRHPDLFEGLRLVMRLLSGEENGKGEGLAVVPLGSFLFSDGAVVDVIDCKIANHHLLKAVYTLSQSYDKDAKIWRTVDYRNLGPEELGSVYESLLELQPQINVPARTFALATAGGNERKTTGSYYTPSSLINALLDSALDPVLNEAMAPHPPTPSPSQAGRGGASTAEERILNLKICDPACGSGHFLIAAAHRIAKALASVRTGEEEPSPAAIQEAKRDVIGRCIYGVDINPMAVELCKVNLWMEALEPGKPLSFLESHIRTGNSLLGTTPKLMADGIPDDAFNPIEGDDKKALATLQRANREARKQREAKVLQLGLFDQPAPPADYAALNRAAAELNTMDDDTLDDLRRKEAAYAALATGSEAHNARLLADAWCAAFVWEKAALTPSPSPSGRGESIAPLTDLTYRRLENALRDGTVLTDDLIAVINEVARLRDRYQFFHWHVAFPDVFPVPNDAQGAENEQTGWDGGFSCVLGNPPWDTLSPDLKEFFSLYDAEIRNQDKEGQDAIVAKLLEDPYIKDRWHQYSRDLYMLANFYRNSSRYSLFAPGNLGKGDFNAYRIFVEAAFQTSHMGASFAQIVPEGLYGGANAMAIRKSLFEETNLRLIFGFENSGGVWFRDAHRSLKFCLYSASKGGITSSFEVAFNIRTESEFQKILTQERLRLPVSLVSEFSPDALAIMEIDNKEDISIATKMYDKFPKLGQEIVGTPYRQFMTEIHMGNDRELFGNFDQGYPLYEGRMVSHYDHKAKGYRSGRGRKAVWVDLEFGDKEKTIQPQWRVPVERLPAKTRVRIETYRIGFCDVTSPTNERSLVATIIPPETICGHKVPTISFDAEFDWYMPVWLAVANSFSIDYLARNKVSLSMSYTVLNSLPFPRPKLDDPILKKLIPLVLQLVVTGEEMFAFWNQMAKYGFVERIDQNSDFPGLLDDLSRLKAVCQIETLVSKQLFGLNKHEIAHILGTFPIVQRREIEKYGSFITRDLILNMFDME